MVRMVAEAQHVEQRHQVALTALHLRAESAEGALEEDLTLTPTPTPTLILATTLTPTLTLTRCPGGGAARAVRLHR